MIWTEESAAWLLRAYRHGSAAKALCDRIAPKIKESARVCDAGCGVGALSLELARRGFDVAALDISPVALNQLRSCEDAALERIDVLCEDAYMHTPDTPYDAMIFSFFGSMGQCLNMARRCCMGDVFYISRNYDTHRFSVGSHPVRYSGYRQARELLDRLGIPYEAAEFEMDMGQPFADLEEARRFYLLYSRDDPDMITDEFLKSRLVAVEDDEYPLYLPHMRKAGMLRFSAEDLLPMAAEHR